MNMFKEQQLQILLDARGKTASEMTHAIAMLGDGEMAHGVIALHDAGRNSGIVQGVGITAVVFTVGIGAYVLIKNAVEEKRTKQALLELTKDKTLTIEMSPDDKAVRLRERRCASVAKV